MRVQCGNALCEISRNIRLRRRRWQERWLYLGSRLERRELADNSPARLTVLRDNSSSIICPAHHHPGNTRPGNVRVGGPSTPLSARLFFSSKDASNESAAWAFNWMIDRNDTSSINWPANGKKQRRKREFLPGHYGQKLLLKAMRRYVLREKRRTKSCDIITLINREFYSSPWPFYAIINWTSHKIILFTLAIIFSRSFLLIISRKSFINQIFQFSLHYLKYLFFQYQKLIWII